MKKQGKIFYFLLHLLGFVLLWLVVRKLDWAGFLEVMKVFPLWKYLAGLLVLVLVYGIKALRWHLLNKSFGIATSWRTALIFYLSAGFLSVITPGRLGEFAKIWFLKRKYNTGLTTATSSVIIDRIWDVLVLSLGAGISVILLLTGSSALLTGIFTGMLFLASALLVVYPLVYFKPMLFLSRRFKLLNSKLEEIYVLWEANRFRRMLPSLAISAAAFLMLAALPLLFSAGTAFPISYTTGIGAISISNILSFVPITVAGFGTRELVFTEIWKLSAYPAEVALSISTAYFIITYLGSLVIGGLVYLFNIKDLYKPGEIRKMQR